MKSAQRTVVSEESIRTMILGAFEGKLSVKVEENSHLKRHQELKEKTKSS